MSTKDIKNEITKKKEYEILLEDFSYFDLSFKIILIGNNGKIIFFYKAIFLIFNR